jgi:two-component system OmpR family response regulator
MRIPDHMLTNVNSSRIMATDFSSGRTLVVDEDPAVRHLISEYLGEHGIETVSAMDRSAVARQLAGGDISSIILELRLGQDNGLDLLREIRSSSDVPVIILTGRPDNEVDCVVGLELGADDYLTRPFGIRELYARFRDVLRRRVTGRSLRTRDVGRGAYKFGGWRLDRRSRLLTNPQERPVGLSKGEYTPCCWPSSMRRSGRFRASVCCRRPGSTKTSSIAASMFRCCGCGANWSQTRRRHVSSRPNAASAMSLQFPSNKAVGRISHRLAESEQTWSVK